MTLYVPILFVCAVMSSNPNHCETIQIRQVAATMEACRDLGRQAYERFARAVIIDDDWPFPALTGDVIIRGECVSEFLYETMVRGEVGP